MVINEKIDYQKLKSSIKWVDNIGRIISLSQMIFWISFFSQNNSLDQTAMFFFAIQVLIFPILFIIFVLFGFKVWLILNKMSKQKIIPTWIPKRRLVMVIVWILLINPFFQIFGTGLILILTKGIGVIYLLIPWALLEVVHFKESKILEPYLSKA